MARQFTLTALIPSEADIHKSYIQWAQTQKWYPALIHIPNEFPLDALPDHRKWGYLKKRKAMGMKSGVPDLFLAWPTTKHHGLWIEVKKPGKKPRESQQEFLTLMKELGYAALWEDNLDALIRSTKNYLNA